MESEIAKLDPREIVLPMDLARAIAGIHSRRARGMIVEDFKTIRRQMDELHAEQRGWRCIETPRGESDFQFSPNWIRWDWTLSYERAKPVITDD